MPLEILCTPDFTNADNKMIDRIATTLGVSRESAIRRAVKFFAAKCVPTHLTLPGASLSHGVCVPTHAARRVRRATARK